METLTYYTQFFFSGLTVGSIYALVGLGFALVYNVSKVLNFAQGEFVMLGGMAMIYLVKALQLPISLAFVLSILFVAVVGFLIDLIAIRPVQKGSFLIMILITIGISAFIQGIAGLVFGREHLSFPPLFFQGKVLSLFGAVFDPQVISIIALTVLASISLKIFLARTWDGKALRACGENKITAYLLGINVPYMRTLSFALSGALGALGRDYGHAHLSHVFPRGCNARVERYLRGCDWRAQQYLGGFGRGIDFGFVRVLRGWDHFFGV